MIIITLTLIIGIGLASITWQDFTTSIAPVYIGYLISLSGGIIANAYNHSRKIKAGETINHKTEALKRWWVILYTLAFSLHSGLIINFFLLGAVWFWILFDLAINYYMSWDFNYVGDTAFLDRIFDGWVEQYMAKFCLFIVMSTLIFVL